MEITLNEVDPSKEIQGAQGSNVETFEGANRKIVKNAVYEAIDKDPRVPMKHKQALGLRKNQIEVGDKVITYIVTPTKFYLDMQTKVQGPGGKIMLTRYAQEVLKRVEESYDVDDFTPAEINEVIEGFDAFCNGSN